MHERERKPDHDELDLLLPWYVNGTLDANEHARVERHLADCAECRANVALLVRMKSSANTDLPTPIVPPSRVEALLDEIDEEDARKGAYRRVSFVAVAAALAVVLVGVTFVVSNRTTGPTESLLFETATSGEADAAIDYVFVVEFEPGMQPGQRQLILDEFGGTETGPGDSPASYEVAVRLPAVTLEELGRYTERMEARPDVRTVKLVAVKLPVR